MIADANPWYLLLALLLMVATILPMAWRWQLLLRAKGVEDNLRWLTRAYFVSYAAGQILPTSVGGDAVRIYETARRHPGHGDTAAASVLLYSGTSGLSRVRPSNPPTVLRCTSRASAVFPVASSVSARL